MAKQPEAASEFVATFLESGVATEADIQRLITAQAVETTQLEYKGGDWLAGTARARRGKPSKPGPRLTAWTSSFANVAGGVLLVGIDTDADDVPTKVNPDTCRMWAADAEALRQKATDALRALAARHPVPLRIAVVEHSDGLVLVVGAERAPELLACEEPGGAPVYYVRSFDGTVALADVAAVDLLVGRRARPTIGVDVHLEQSNAGPDGFQLRVRARIRNDGLVWISDVRAGMLYRSAACRDARSSLEERFARAVDTSEPACVAHVAATEVNYKWGPLPPMSELTSIATTTLPGRAGNFEIAVYVVAEGHPPTWFQLRGRIALTANGLLLDKEWTTVECRGTRARVGFDPE